MLYTNYWFLRVRRFHYKAACDTNQNKSLGFADKESILTALWTSYLVFSIQSVYVLGNTLGIDLKKSKNNIMVFPSYGNHI